MKAEQLLSKALLEVKQLSVEFPLNKSFLEQLTVKNFRLIRHHQSIKAVNKISFNVLAGETLCLVGESGCGKSTVARAVVGLQAPSSGKVYYSGQDVHENTRDNRLRRKLQMVFQNPYASLNPRMRIQQTLEEPLKFHEPDLTAQEIQERLIATMEAVGADSDWAQRYPHEFSGGQRQRISLARALIVNPEFIVADEPISALDVSIQAQVLNLLMEARENRGLTYLFITHDLSVVEHFGTRVVVMYLGKICEIADTQTLFMTPRHPYTNALMSAIPKLNNAGSQHIRLLGEVPTPIALPTGCVFHGRCQFAAERCKVEIPELHRSSNGSWVACHAVEEGRD